MKIVSPEQSIERLSLPGEGGEETEEQGGHYQQQHQQGAGEQQHAREGDKHSGQ